MIEIEVVQETSFVVFCLKGELDSQVSSDFDTWFETKVNEGYLLIGIDLLHTTYLSSMGIGSLKKAHNLLKINRGVLIIYNLNHEVKQLVSFLHLDKNLHICKNFEEASKLFSKIAIQSSK